MARTDLAARFWMTAAVAVALSAFVAGCEQEPDISATPEAALDAERAAATQPKPKSTINLGNDPTAPYRARAEKGETPAMLLLGRSAEIKGDRAEARYWYLKAADAGDASGSEALKMMEATAAASPQAPASAPAAGPAAPSAPSAAAATGPALAFGAAASTRPGEPVDLTKLRWSDVLASLDVSDFVTVERPDYKQKPTDEPAYIALTTAPDKTITVAAKGPAANDIREVTLVIRLRTKQDLKQHQRVWQAGIVARNITRNNVETDEMVQWVDEYVKTGQRSAPIFRNGWSIRVSGPAGEGNTDPKSYLGQAVVIELKK